MKILTGILIVSAVFWFFVQGVTLWGAHKCSQAGGKWVSMGYGKHCVDSNLNDISYL